MVAIKFVLVTFFFYSDYSYLLTREEKQIRGIVTDSACLGLRVHVISYGWLQAILM